MAIMSLGRLNKNILFPLFAGISKCISTSLIRYGEIKIHNHPLLLGINAGLAMSFAFIPLIITKIKMKSSKSYGKEKLKLLSILLIIMCSILDFVNKFLSFCYIYGVNKNIWIINIIYFSVFSYFILKTKLYNHQYFSSLIMIIAGVGINIIALYNMESQQIYQLLLSIFIEATYSLAFVLNKYLIEYHFCSAEELCCYEGLFILFLNILLLAIFNNYIITKDSILSTIFNTVEYDGKKYLDNFYQYYNEINLNEILLFCVYFFTRFIFYFFSFMTIKYYSPSHIILILIIGEFIYVFFDIKKETWKIVLNAFLLTIILLMVLIYLEIIELNFCGLDENLKRNIDLRAKLKEENEIFDDSNTQRFSNDSNLIYDNLEISFQNNAN